MKFTEADLPAGYSIKVHHLHCGNSSKHERHGKEYVTKAAIVAPDGKVVVKKKAYCSKQDHPSRRIGREVAIGRVLKEFFLKAHNVLSVQTASVK